MAWLISHAVVAFVLVTFLCPVASTDVEGGGASALSVRAEPSKPYSTVNMIGEGGNGRVFLVKTHVDDMPDYLAMKTTFEPLDFTKDADILTWKHFAEECAAMFVANCKGSGVARSYGPTLKFRELALNRGGWFEDNTYPAFRERSRSGRYFPRCLMEPSDTTLRQYMNSLEKPTGTTERQSAVDNLKHIQSIMFQILTGLKTLRDMGIMHGDLKPSNILLWKNKQLRLDLGDLGNYRYVYRDDIVSRDWAAVACPKSTEQYQSPEVWKACDEYEVTGKFTYVMADKLDLFPVGLILFELLAGQSYYGWCITEMLPKLSTDLNLGEHAKYRVANSAIEKHGTIVPHQMMKRIILYQKNVLNVKKGDEAFGPLFKAAFLMNLLLVGNSSLEDILESEFLTEEIGSGERMVMPESDGDFLVEATVSRCEELSERLENDRLSKIVGGSDEVPKGPKPVQRARSDGTVDRAGEKGVARGIDEFRARMSQAHSVSDDNEFIQQQRSEALKQARVQTSSLEYDDESFTRRVTHREGQEEGMNRGSTTRVLRGTTSDSMS